MTVFYSLLNIKGVDIMQHLYHVAFMAPDCTHRVREQHIYVEVGSDLEARERFYTVMPEGCITSVHMAGDWGPEEKRGRIYFIVLKKVLK